MNVWFANLVSSSFFIIILCNDTLHNNNGSDYYVIDDELLEFKEPYAFMSAECKQLVDEIISADKKCEFKV